MGSSKLTAQDSNNIMWLNFSDFALSYFLPTSHFQVINTLQSGSFWKYFIHICIETCKLYVI